VRNCEEKLVAYLTLLSQHLPGEGEENCWPE